MKFNLILDKIEDDEFAENNPRKRESLKPPDWKHPFFMAPSERNAHRLTQHIQASNTLNRSIQINLVSEEEDEDNLKPAIVSRTSGFFQKRIKPTLENGTSPAVKFRKIASSDAPPYPLEFQLYKTKHFPFEAKLFSAQIIKY